MSRLEEIGGIYRFMNHMRVTSYTGGVLGGECNLRLEGEVREGGEKSVLERGEVDIGQEINTRTLEGVVQRTSNYDELSDSDRMLFMTVLKLGEDMDALSLSCIYRIYRFKLCVGSKGDGSVESREISSRASEGLESCGSKDLEEGERERLKAELLRFYRKYASHRLKENMVNLDLVASKYYKHRCVLNRRLMNIYGENLESIGRCSKEEMTLMMRDTGRMRRG